MTTFNNGPAMGQNLALKSSPRFLRVVCLGLKWDALDQPHDAPAAEETIFAYELAERSGTVHINRGGGRGGFYPLADYRFAEPQPTEAVMRDAELWQRWCEERAAT